ncbi:hypothetical protein B566_EDAN004717 [Ephemera danica]|nr:hypothetical protein B566_EDAN004717 [Ephemera danica]
MKNCSALYLFVCLVISVLSTALGDEEILFEAKYNGKTITVTINQYETNPDQTQESTVTSFNPSPRLPSCQILDTGRFPVFGNCSLFLECTRNTNKEIVRRIIQCSPGQRFRYVEQICDFPDSENDECEYGRLFAERTENFHFLGVTGSTRVAGMKLLNRLMFTPTSVEKTNDGMDFQEDTTCLRPCKSGETRVCNFVFVVEEYASMCMYCKNCPFNIKDCDLPGCIPAGGIQKPIVTINRRIPGPAIQVCKGDVIQVEVQNHLSAGATTIHWHGFHQKDSPYMDGVPFLTQCPILARNTFRYSMIADVAGTHFYHSHSGHHEADGVFGALIVREPRNLELGVASRYDEDLPEHNIVIWHWYKRPAETETIETALVSQRREGNTFLINGKGNTEKFFSHEGERKNLPIEIYRGIRYRFRAIYNSALYCPVQVSVDGHVLDILASDGHLLAEQVNYVDSVFLTAGERYDFVLHPHWSINTFNQSFYIRIRGLNDCGDKKNGAFQTAVLRYDGSNAELNGGEMTRPLIFARHANAKTLPDLSRKPDRIFYAKIGFEMYIDTDFITFLPQVNKISWQSPSSPPLTQPNTVTNETFCRPELPKNCRNGICRCPQVIEMNRGELIEIVLVDEDTGGLGHPFHLHGYSFQVVAMEQGKEKFSVKEVQTRNEAGLIKKYFDGPVKDTVVVPIKGFVIFRFVANNPGYWLLHCHVSAHVSMGMALVLKVGQHSEMLKPPANFPTCGDYL